ncbi:MAG TPA: SPFH domain-containing protein [Nocardioides sp.]|uniref:SPFH domain-containing protein n=1 Tax=Nocardioides sp. TaxID=35761 RepID=UPI002C4A3C31|nr:SPFH domain-containing protein [Nocardioides sp.]HTW17775.1 SPFH domain-containing protein [Nocardioides sp.]
MSLFRSTTTVRSQFRLLEYVDGALTRVLGPGRHRPRRRAEYELVLVADRIETVAPQEVPTSDGVSVRVSAAVRWGVDDPRAFEEATVDASAVVYLAVQVALRDALVGTPAEDAVHLARTGLAEQLTEAARAAGAEVGIGVRSVVIKDVLLPGELRAAYADLVAARTRGLAQLEAARAETAALRSLANGAKLLDEHPALARLRLVQALPPGSTVELG